MSFRIVFIFIISERIISNYTKMGYILFFLVKFPIFENYGVKKYFRNSMILDTTKYETMAALCWAKVLMEKCVATLSTPTNPRPVRGVDATPPWVFLSWTPHRLEDRAEIFHSLWGIFCGTFGEKNLVGSGQVTKLWRHKRNNLRKISAKSWVNATWRGAIDFNGDSWWDWCQYMTGCDPWHCDRWGSRSNKVTWGHWPRLTSQWQITNQHMFSGVSWGAESESMVQCP